jgi:hypothetical protein
MRFSGNRVESEHGQSSGVKRQDQIAPAAERDGPIIGLLLDRFLNVADKSGRQYAPLDHLTGAAEFPPEG